VELQNLTVTGGWAGVYGSDAAGVELVNITASSNGWAGIVLDGCDSPAVRCATLDGKRFAGVHIRGCASGAAMRTSSSAGLRGNFRRRQSVHVHPQCHAAQERLGRVVRERVTNGAVTNSIIAAIQKRAYYGIYVETPRKAASNRTIIRSLRDRMGQCRILGSIRRTLSAWRTGSACDANSMSAEPVMVDPDNIDPALRDYRLQAGSPCI